MITFTDDDLINTSLGGCLCTSGAQTSRDQEELNMKQKDGDACIGGRGFFFKLYQYTLLTIMRVDYQLN